MTVALEPDSAWYSTGWFVALLAATWGVVLRFLIGRYNEFQKESKEDREAMRRSIQSMERRLDYLEGQLESRRRP